MFNSLRTFFVKVIGRLPIDKKYFIKYYITSWHSKAFTGEEYNKLLNNFVNQSMIYSVEQQHIEQDSAENLVSDSDNGVIPHITMFSKLQFVEIGTKKDNVKVIKFNKDIGGAFFKYLITRDTPKMVIEYLRRLQIFDTLYERKADSNKVQHFQRSELNDNYFIYALIQTGEYTEDELNKMRLRIKNRYLHKNAINDICNEFMIHIKMTYIDDNAEGKNKRRNITQQSGSTKNYIGVEERDAKHIHRLALYQTHYFIEEQTPFSTYYIKHMRSTNKKYYNKHYEACSGKWKGCNNKSRPYYIWTTNRIC